MSEVPTIQVIRVDHDGPVTINEADFDPAVHERYTEDSGLRELADHTVVELKAMAAERGVDLGDAIKKADIVAALELAAEASGED